MRKQVSKIKRGATQCRRAATKAKKDGNLIVTDAHVMKK